MRFLHILVERPPDLIFGKLFVFVFLQRKQFPNLFCEVRYGRLPYYFWWNVEHLHNEPRITMIYNIISDAEAERLKVAVKPSVSKHTTT